MIFLLWRKVQLFLCGGGSVRTFAGSESPPRRGRCMLHKVKIEGAGCSVELMNNEVSDTTSVT